MRTAVALFASLTLSVPLSAQVTNLPNTGCFSQGYPTPTGTPRLGQVFGTDYDPGRSQGFAAIGLVATPGPLAPTIACQPGCNIGVAPIAMVAGSSWSVAIPSAPALVGTCLAAQHALVGLIGPPCMELTGAVQFCIQP